MRQGDRWIIDRAEKSMNHCYTFYCHMVLADGSIDEEEWDYDEYGSYWTSTSREHPCDIVDILLSGTDDGPALSSKEEINLDDKPVSAYREAKITLVNGQELTVLSCSETASGNYTIETYDETNRFFIMDYNNKGESLDNNLGRDIHSITFKEE